MPNILVNNNFYQGTSSACIVDIVPPTFAGVATTVVGSRGQIVATWLAATDPTPPIRYEVYIQATTATGLFNILNIVGITDKLQFSTFTMPDGSFLVNGTTYYVGVRALDAVSNRDSNTVSLSVISTGVFVSADIYDAEGAFAINTSNQMQGTIWCLKNSGLASSANATMGTASFQVYDKAGVAVPGMGGSGIAADVNGQYKITPVASTLATTLDHYMVKITVNVDGANREGYVALIEPIPDYVTVGAFAIDQANNLVASFWVTANGENVDNLARLGLGHYHVYDAAGIPVPGMTESNISPNADGVYVITPITSTLDVSASAYFAHIRIEVDSVDRENTIPIVFAVPEYESKAQFSINALNQFQGTLWATADDNVKTTGLGAANYTVYDSAGVAVVGLTQSGITADVNGRFQLAPVSAAALTDLTHYSVKIGIVVDGVERVSYKGFTLLGG